MDLLAYARAQMGLSLAFHIVFAAVGVALPVLLFISDALYMRTKDPDYLACRSASPGARRSSCRTGHSESRWER